MVRAKVVTVMRWYAQDEVNQEESEQNEVDGMKKGADKTILIIGIVLVTCNVLAQVLNNSRPIAFRWLRHILQNNDNVSLFFSW